MCKLCINRNTASVQSIVKPVIWLYIFNLIFPVFKTYLIYLFFWICNLFNIHVLLVYLQSTCAYELPDLYSFVAVIYLYFTLVYFVSLQFTYEQNLPFLHFFVGVNQLYVTFSILLLVYLLSTSVYDLPDLHSFGPVTHVFSQQKIIESIGSYVVI